MLTRTVVAGYALLLSGISLCDAAMAQQSDDNYP
jgi:hypothetical protein